jgi:hypothetical protein
MFNDKVSRHNYIIPFFASFVVALMFIYTDWERVFGSSFEDRQVFLDVFQGKSEYDVEFKFETFFFFLFNEQLWDRGVRFLNIDMGFSVPEIFTGISFLTVFCYAFFIVRRVGLGGLILLVNPLFIDMAYSQLRISAAMCFLLTAYNVRFVVLRVLLLSCAFFIHTASFLFVMIALSAAIIVRISERKQLSPLVSYFMLVAVGLSVAAVVGPLRVAILEFLGDRRTDYEIAAATWSYASMWLLLLAISIFQPPAFLRNYTNAIAIVFLAVFTFCTFFSVYGVRFLSAALPFIIVLLLRLGSLEKPAVFILFCGYAMVQWSLWFR